MTNATGLASRCRDANLRSSDITIARGATPMSFILADACVVTVNSASDVYEQSSVLVREDRIVDIGSKAELTAKEPHAEVINCSSNILMPGMVNTHTHLFQTLLKGPGDDMVLKDWFTCMTGPAAVELTAADVHAAAMHGCVESIRSGHYLGRVYVCSSAARTYAPRDRRVRGHRYARICLPRFFQRWCRVWRASRLDRNSRNGPGGCTGASQRAEPTPDLVLVDMSDFFVAPIHDPTSALVYSAL